MFVRACVGLCVIVCLSTGMCTRTHMHKHKSVIHPEHSEGVIDGTRVLTDKELSVF